MHICLREVNVDKKKLLEKEVHKLISNSANMS